MKDNAPLGDDLIVLKPREPPRTCRIAELRGQFPIGHRQLLGLIRQPLRLARQQLAVNRLHRSFGAPVEVAPGLEANGAAIQQVSNTADFPVLTLADECSPTLKECLVELVVRNEW